MPAAKAGLKAGDAILEIDGEDVRKSSVKEVSDKLKGTPEILPFVASSTP
ncbi:MAG: PDZ domain-containing protein [Candidatus Pacebacteria bacterium]|nr:PDZ domain-containing protein [Candidatus Paceibacterota bacterium]